MVILLTIKYILSLPILTRNIVFISISDLSIFFATIVLAFEGSFSSVWAYVVKHFEQVAERFSAGWVVIRAFENFEVQAFFLDEIVHYKFFTSGYKLIEFCFFYFKINPLYSTHLHVHLDLVFLLNLVQKLRIKTRIPDAFVLSSVFFLGWFNIWLVLKFIKIQNII